ncbi:phosphodiester glycosidase family protein [Jiangella asiatica]|uniref:Multidrug transporter n=1 Tax=Jiangella asiatica TaxID=2530372 RepID=A0A4R5CIE5_9ACTN|nr:phosphodiester glycosidase family protein [Jiangella asiatica]TDD98876.1 multidrug transporter [Jiangella asiatica]
MLNRRARVIIPAAVTALIAAATAVTTPTAVAVDPDDLTRPGESVLVETGNETIAPGMELTTFSRLEDGGWNAGSVLEVDLDAGVTLDYQYSGEVTRTATVRSLAEASGATAAINGDFYDINNSNAPLGAGVSRDEGMVTAPTAGHENALAVSSEGAVQLAQVFLEGTAVTGDGVSLRLAGVNTFRLPADGIGVFTSAWGEYTRANTVDGAAGKAEVAVVDGVVTAVGTTLGVGPIAADTMILVGRDAGAAALLELQPGDTVDVTYAPRSDLGEVAVAVGGNHMLVDDGVQRTFTDTEPAARSAVGLSEDGRTMYLVSIDGKQAHSRGMTLTETAEVMHDLGAYDALNIDGGGSSTLVVRDPATDDHAVVNSPSDGSERSVSNGLALFAAEGSGELDGFRVTAGAVTSDPDGTADGYSDDGIDRVFPGLTRTVQALGHDETYAPVAARPRWQSSDRRVATVTRDADGTATVTGVRPGEADIEASLLGADGEVEITVLGELRHIEPTATLVPLGGADDTGRVELTGYDVDGYRAPIEPADVTVAGVDGVVELVPDGDGFSVRPLTDNGSALVRLEAAGVETSVAVTIGLEEVTVADFADAADWTVAFARATGTIAPAQGPDGRDAVELTYDFTGPNTRAAYAMPPAQFSMPGQPQAVNAWVEGDGQGTWIRMRVYDRNGTLLTLNGGYTTFTGWQQLTFPVPPGTEYPLTFRDIYAVEASGARSYHGTTSFSDISVEIAPEVDLPVEDRFEDPVIVTNGTVDDAAQQIAVMSDSQFVGRDPGSDIVAAARRTLQEIVAADPDALVINGDLVDEAAPIDFDLARQVLDEELAGVDFPWYYVPGNHEVQGGPIDNFVAEFGATQNTVDIETDDGTTRIITLNSAFGTLRGGGFDQIAQLRAGLDEAAADPEVTGVLVFAHHPPNDPLPTANSQLADRREAAMLETWLADFEAASGKSAAFVGAHAGVFDASSVDGVPFLVNGNSGKGPASTPDHGGFTGWTMLGLEPSHGDHGDDDAWLRAEVIARVDAIALDVPATLAVGATGSVSATVDQDGVRTVPVQWPVSALWGGDGVHVGAPADAPRDAVVAVDPAAGTIQGLRSGTATVTVTVNGWTATRDVTVG